MSPPDLTLEKGLWAKGKTPAGVDEAGRGPLAGPVVAAAVILPESFNIPGLDDSKKLTHSERVAVLECIVSSALAFAVGIVHHEEIDRINILRASLRAMEIAVGALGKKPDFLLVDGNQKTSLLIPQETVVKGDSRCCSIAAASIVAKVKRDQIMDEYHEIYPQYNFRSHKGYPTREHLEAIRRYGPCPIHRKSFRGVIQTELWTSL
ncbi:MAG TPA: ribonuclease HII [Thermodesulfobacteriota bacterium]|nr:ribonuclease HII [Thermodesulfobacteriota bacterium]